MSIRPLLVFVISIIMTHAGFAQPLPGDYELFTKKDGLPNNNISRIYQDSYGLLWIGTYEGICLYDGYQFKTFADVFDRKENNWMHTVIAIYEDEKRNVWLLSRTGLVSCFIRREQTFKKIIDTPSEVRATAIFKDNDGLWLGYEDGNLEFIPINAIAATKAGKEPVQKTIQQKVNVCSQGILGMALNNQETLIIYSYSGIYSFDKLTRKTAKIDSINYIADVDISHQRTAILASGTIHLYNKKNFKDCTNITVVQGKKSILYYRIALAQNGDCYYTNGLYIYKYDAGKRMIEKYLISDYVGFNQNELISDLVADKSGVLWIGSTSGLYMLNTDKQKFTKYSINNIEGKLSYNYVRAIYADKKNNIWVGYKSGEADQLQYDKDKARYLLSGSHYSINTTNKIQSKNYTVNTFLQTREGTILAGASEGLFKIGPGRKLYYLLPAPWHFTVSEIWSLYEDKNSNIWIGTNSYGLFVYTPENQKIYQYTAKADNKTSISNNSIWKIYEDKRGRVWLCTDRGLNLVANPAEVNNLQFSNFPLEENNAYRVWNITEDKNGNLWTGTIGNGLFKISPATDKVTSIKDLPAKNISAIVADNSNNLWLTTTNGLYKYIPGINKTEYFTEDDGLINSDFNFNTAILAPKGQILLGTKTGIVSFNPGEISAKEHYNAPFIITSLYIEGIDSTRAIYNGDKLDLSRKQNDISISFAMLDYATSRNHRFRYKLTGYSNDWTYLPHGHNTAVFTNMSPGSYSFIAESSANGLNWNKQRIVLNIIINPAIWQRPIFIAGVISCIILLIVFIVKRQFDNAIEKERRKTAFEKKIAELELRALQAQMNPHFVFNTLNSIQHFILHHNETEANAYLSRFAKLMRLFLESSKDRYIQLQRELDLLELYISLEQLRFENSFEYRLEISKPITPELIKIPSMLIQPFVENAIKHGLAGRKAGGELLIEISIDPVDKNYIKCIVEDNGIGRKKSAEANRMSLHVSRGLQLIEDRIKTYNFIEGRKISINIIDKVSPSEGTRVEILLPIYINVPQISLS